MADARGPQDRPVLLTRTAQLVLLEAVALALLGVCYAVSGVVGEPEDRLATVLAGGFALAVGLALVAVARALGLGRGWALAPTVLLQLFMIIVAVGLLQGAVYAVGLPLLAAGAAVLCLLTRPPVRGAFADPA